MATIKGHALFKTCLKRDLIGGCYYEIFFWRLWVDV